MTDYLSGERIQGSSATTPYTFPTSATAQELDVSSLMGDPSSLDVSPNGVYLFAFSGGGTNDDVVIRWTMSTPWDLSTASQDQTYDAGVQTTSPKGVRFNTDGTRMFVSSRYAGSGGDDNYVYQYNLSVGWDLTSTVTQPEEADISTLVGSTANISSLNFNADGTKMFLSAYGTAKVWEFTISTGFDLGSTVAFVDFFDFTGSTGESYSVGFMDSGKTLIITDKGNDNLVACPLTTGYDVSTGSATPSATLDISSANTDPMGVSISGVHLYTLDGNGGDCCRFNLGTTDEKATITNVPVGTRYEETDTRKIYRWKAESTVEVEDADGYGTIVTSSAGSSSNQKAHDFGSAILGDFVFRTTMNCSMGNTGQNGGVAMFLSTNDANYQGAAHDSVVGALGHKHNASNSRGYAWGQGDNTHNSSALDNAQDAIWEAQDVGDYADNTPAYGLDIQGNTKNYEIERSGTTLTFKIFSSGWSSPDSTQTATGAATTKYRYVYFAGRHQGDMTASNSYWKVSYTEPAQWKEKGTA